MIVYNVTSKVNTVIHQQWLQWIKQVHIPEILETQCFTDAKCLQLLDVDDEEGPTFVVQFYAESKEQYENYIHTFAPALRQKSFAKWGNNFISFRSLMQEV
jgi:Domain of unknown function (DUF4286)